MFHRPGEVTAWLAVRAIVDFVQTSEQVHGQDCSCQRRPRVGRRRGGCFFILWLRRRRARSLIRGLFQDYFAESFAAEELGRRVRASVGRRFTGGSEFFAEAVAAFQHAVNARLPATHTAQDEAKLLGQFAALKTEFGLTDRYRIEGWRAGRE